MDSHESEVSSNDGVHMAVNVANMHTADGVDDFIHEQYSEEPLRAYLPQFQKNWLKLLLVGVAMYLIERKLETCLKLLWFQRILQG